MNKLLKFIFILTLILLITTLNFKLLALNFNFYQKEFSKLDIYEIIPKEIADKETLNLINYLNNKQELTTEFFNEREKLHLQDVKNLIQKTFLIFYIALILFIIMLIYFIYTKNYKIIYSSFLVSTLLLIIILVILSLINFNFLFTQFHLISFSNDYWQLNPETDNLINLFPLQFFQDIIKKIVINIIVTSFIFIIIALVIKFTIKQKVFK